jgi:hypothetical protein
MTNDKIIEMAKQYGYWSGQTIEMNDVGIINMRTDIVERLRTSSSISLDIGDEAADEIESLRQRVAELEADKDAVKLFQNGEVMVPISRLSACEKERDDLAAINLKNVVEWRNELAACQYYAQKLREALAGISANRYYEGKVGWEQLYKRAAIEASYALSLTHDTSALDAMVARFDAVIDEAMKK